MLQVLSVEEAMRVAELARAARVARDQMLLHLAEQKLDQPRPAFGGQDAAGPAGLDVLPADQPQRVALNEAILALSAEAQRELWVLASVGQGRYGINDWARAVEQAAGQTDQVIQHLMLDQPDLHEWLTKGLHEMKRAEGQVRK